VSRFSCNKCTISPELHVLYPVLICRTFPTLCSRTTTEISDGTVGFRDNRSLDKQPQPTPATDFAVCHCERDNYASLTNSFSLMWKPRVHRGRDTIVRTVGSFGRTDDDVVVKSGDRTTRGRRVRQWARWERERERRDTERVGGAASERTGSIFRCRRANAVLPARRSGFAASFFRKCVKEVEKERCVRLKTRSTRGCFLNTTLGFSGLRERAARIYWRTVLVSNRVRVISSFKICTRARTRLYFIQKEFTALRG